MWLLFFSAPMLSGRVWSLSRQIHTLKVWSVAIFNVFRMKTPQQLWETICTINHLHSKKKLFLMFKQRFWIHFVPPLSLVFYLDTTKQKISGSTFFALLIRYLHRLISSPLDFSVPGLQPYPSQLSLHLRCSSPLTIFMVPLCTFLTYPSPPFTQKPRNRGSTRCCLTSIEYRIGITSSDMLVILP